MRDGACLVVRRPAGSHLAGLWEFPGGKIERGETPETALARELREEIGVGVEILERLLTVSHPYPDRRIEITFYLCRIREGRPPPGGEALRWVRIEDLREGQFPPANAEVLRLLRKRGHGQATGGRTG